MKKEKLLKKNNALSVRMGDRYEQETTPKEINTKTKSEAN